MAEDKDTQQWIEETSRVRCSKCDRPLGPEDMVRTDFATEYVHVCRACCAAPRQETQASISAWIEETFGPAGSNARVIARANEEMAELLRDVTVQDDSPNLAEEMADVFIVLYRVATRIGVDLHAEIDKKMARNRARRWALDGSGCGYHVKDK